MNDTLRPDELIIGDDNYKDFCAPIGESTILLPDGSHRAFGFAGRQHPFGYAFGKIETRVPLIPRSEWKQRILEGEGGWLSSIVARYGMKSKDQDGLGYCWVYGPTRALEIIRVIEGSPFEELSPESVGGPVRNWRNEGGYAEEAFTQLEEFGACHVDYMDAPNSLSPKRWKVGWEANREDHRIEHKWYDINSSFDEVMSCLLAHIPVAAGLNWWGHLICYLDPVIMPNGGFGVRFQNSWGVDWPSKGANGLATLTEAKATPDGAGAPLVATASN